MELVVVLWSSGEVCGRLYVHDIYTASVLPWILFVNVV